MYNKLNTHSKNKILQPFVIDGEGFHSIVVSQYTDGTQLSRPLRYNSKTKEITLMQITMSEASWDMYFHKDSVMKINKLSRYTYNYQVIKEDYLKFKQIINKSK